MNLSTRLKSGVLIFVRGTKVVNSLSHKSRGVLRDPYGRAFMDDFKEEEGHGTLNLHTSTAVWQTS